MAHFKRIAFLVLVTIALQSACTPEEVTAFAAQNGVELAPEHAQVISLRYSGDVEAMIRHRWAGTGQADRAVRIARCESGLNPHAQNRRSSAYGVLQFLDSTWRSTGIAKTPDPWLQVEAGYRLWKARGWQPWVCRG